MWLCLLVVERQVLFAGLRRLHAGAQVSKCPLPHPTAPADARPLLSLQLQGSDPATEQLLDRLCAERGLQLHRLPRATEMIKADGALTCCSILL